MNDNNKSKFSLVLSMVIFGTIGVFVRHIPVPSSVIAFSRAVIGMIFIALFFIFTKYKVSWKSIKNNLILLLISGTVMGFNWVLLFESYKYTTVAAATLCYYLAPIFVIIASPFVLKEKLTLKKVLCTIVAIFGMVLVSGILTHGVGDSAVIGACLAIGAALLYATVVILNKKFKDISSYDRTIVQLATAAVAILPYIFATESITDIRLEVTSALLLLTVGALHTGLAYVLYFGSVAKIKAQSVAIMSYIDPIVATVLSFTLLGEDFDALGIIGAVLILGATVISEVELKTVKK